MGSGGFPLPSEVAMTTGVRRRNAQAACEAATGDPNPQAVGDEMLCLVRLWFRGGHQRGGSREFKIAL
jgi:hypothetical protein